MKSPEEYFLDSIIALEPWLDQIVIIGGWAHILYHHHPLALDPGYQPLSTLDTDIAISRNIRSKRDNIRSRLLAKGFVEDRRGSDTPPVTHYYPGEIAINSFYLEFLSPLTGSGNSRGGKRKATETIAGITSQRLRYIDILLLHPWTIQRFIKGNPNSIQVANPVSFIAQKLLIHSNRSSEDQAKDILYIHDTLELFGPNIPSLKALWKEDIFQKLSRKQRQDISTQSEKTFHKIHDGIISASRIPRSRTLTPESIQQVCEYGMNQIFI